MNDESAGESKTSRAADLHDGTCPPQGEGWTGACTVDPGPAAAPVRHSFTTQEVCVTTETPSGQEVGPARNTVPVQQLQDSAIEHGGTRTEHDAAHVLQAASVNNDSGGTRRRPVRLVSVPMEEDPDPSDTCPAPRAVSGQEYTEETKSRPLHDAVPAVKDFDPADTHPRHLGVPGQEHAAGTHCHTLHVDVSVQEDSVETKPHHGHFSVRLHEDSAGEEKPATYLALPVNDVIGRREPRRVHVTITAVKGSSGGPRTRSVRSVRYTDPQDDDDDDDDDDAEEEEEEEEVVSGGMETSTSHLVDPVQEDDSELTKPHAVHYAESVEEEDAGGSEPRTAHLAAPDEASAAAVSRSMLVAVSAEDGLATDLRALCFNIPEEISVPAEASSVHSVVFVQDTVGKETYDLLFPAPVCQGTAGISPQYVAPAAPTQGDGGRTEPDSGGTERRSVHFPALGEHGFKTCLVKAASGAVPRRVQDATGGREAASGAVPRRVQAAGPRPRVNKRKARVPVRRVDAAGEVGKDLWLFKCPHYLLMYQCEVCNAHMEDQHRTACRMLYRHHEKLRLRARQERVKRLNAQLQAEREGEDLTAKRMNAGKEEEEDADDDCSGDDDDDTTSDSDDAEGAHGGRRVYRVS